jgi:hypothetical protein
MEEISRALGELKEMLEELEHNSTNKYVFVPLLNNVNYEYKEPVLTLTNKNNITIKIKILGNNHITKIRENNGKIDINNILILTGFAINENSLGLVRTLDPCDYVRGILVNGKIQQIENNNNLSKMEIIYPDVKLMMNKLYFIRRSDVDLQNNIKITLLLLIDLIAEPNLSKQTKYCSLEMNNQIEEFKRNIRGVADLYGIRKDAINDLVRKLSNIISYYSIIR